VGSRASERGSRGGAFSDAGSIDLDALSANHDDLDSGSACDVLDEVGYDFGAGVGGSGFLPSLLKRSKNFWISGSMLGSFGAVLGVDVDGAVVVVVAALSAGGAVGSLGEPDAQSQPIMSSIGLGEERCPRVYLVV